MCIRDRDCLSLSNSNEFDLAIIAVGSESLSARLAMCAMLVSQLGEDRIVVVAADHSDRCTTETEKAGFSIYTWPLKPAQLQAILSARLGVGLH